MRVLLLQDIKELGQKMDVVNVKDGYARNFLFPKQLARVADKQALVQKVAVDKQVMNDLAQYQEFVKKLSAEKLEFSVKVGEKGEVFDSVNKNKIQKELEKKGYKDFEVELKQPIKELGGHQVKVKFPQGIKGEILVILNKI